jgi:hypothetical protein
MIKISPQRRNNSKCELLTLFICHLLGIWLQEMRNGELSMNHDKFFIRIRLVTFETNFPRRPFGEQILLFKQLPTCHR